MLPAEFHFIRPYWLLAFIPLALLVTLMVKRRLRNRKWETFCDRALLPHILIGDEPVSRRISSAIMALAGSLVIVSLAGPTWQKLPQPVFSTQSALVIALDLSRSMNATDISPSRIDRARFKVADILEQRAEGETALLVYAGDAFTVTPLTDDAGTIQSQLMALTTEIMPAQGNRTDVALGRAIELLRQAGAGKGDILLVTDEIDTDISLPAAGDVRDEGYRLSILAIGTAQGAPITLGDGSFFKDQSGQIVIPRLSEAPMRQLVDSGGGRYQKMTVDDSDVTTLNDFFESNYADGDDVTETDFDTDVWAEEGPWLLLLVIPLAAMAFRRGVLLALLLLCLPVPRNASALDWDSLWLRDDQRGQEILEQGDATRAAELFHDPAWKGAAHYRADDYDAAIQSLQNAEGIENRYNLGNAMARKGLYEQAIALYEEVLEQEPGHEDALYNKELLEKELQEQQQEQQQQTESYSDENQPQQEQEQQDQQQQQDQAQQQQDQQDPSEQDQQMQETEQQDKEAEQPQPEDEQEDPGQPEPTQANNDKVDEQQQATEQWLRRIPDDPGGLLRRKFLLQYQQRQHDRVPGEKSW